MTTSPSRSNRSLLETGGRGEVYGEGLAPGRSRKPPPRDRRTPAFPVALRFAVPLVSTLETSAERPCSEGFSNVAAGIGQVRGNVGQGLVRDEHHGTAFAEIDDPVLPASAVSLRKPWPRTSIPCRGWPACPASWRPCGRTTVVRRSGCTHAASTCLSIPLSTLRERLNGVPFALIAAHEELEVADLGGKAGQRFP